MVYVVKMSGWIIACKTSLSNFYRNFELLNLIDHINILFCVVFLGGNINMLPALEEKGISTIARYVVF